MNLTNTNAAQLAASTLFISASFFLFLSVRHYGWMLGAGCAVAGAYLLIALTAEGSGGLLQMLGSMAGITTGILMLRDGWKGKTGKQFKLLSVIALVDRYPLAVAGIIGSISCLALCIGAFLSKDFRLAFSAAFWTLAYLALAGSDKRLRTN